MLMVEKRVAMLLNTLENRFGGKPASFCSILVQNQVAKLKASARDVY
jgi:hypothetical protein